MTNEELEKQWREEFCKLHNCNYYGDVVIERELYYKYLGFVEGRKAGQEEIESLKKELEQVDEVLKSSVNNANKLNVEHLELKKEIGRLDSEKLFSRRKLESDNIKLRELVVQSKPFASYCLDFAEEIPMEVIEQWLKEAELILK